MIVYGFNLHPEDHPDYPSPVANGHVLDAYDGMVFVAAITTSEGRQQMALTASAGDFTIVPAAMLDQHDYAQLMKALVHAGAAHGWTVDLTS